MSFKLGDKIPFIYPTSFTFNDLAEPHFPIKGSELPLCGQGGFLYIRGV